ncbi:YvcK family protein [Patescibacteria group bacterium]|nr:YvcK family protein [Patescibacteria group bacterium]
MKRLSKQNNSKSGPKIVVFGGGTGIFNLLRGLKHYSNNIVAIVTMMDSGGSSGRLRDEFGHLPPGDVRQALVALSPDDRSSLTLRQLFNYRFSKGEGLEGHSFGNLFLTALAEITGGADKAVAEAGRILGIRGRVYPVTLTNSNLVARLEDGKEIVGETNIDVRKEKSNAIIDYVYLDPTAYAYPEALREIETADVIVLGPGDLYTSVIPNLLVDGVAGAINYSRAKKVYICNLMTKHNESDGFAASDFVREIKTYLENGKLDYVVVNKGELPQKLVKRYEKEKAQPVEADIEEVKKQTKNVIAKSIAAAGTLLRHDSGKIARIIIDISTR